MCMTFLFRMLGVHQTNFASGVLAWCEEDLRCVTSRNHTHCKWYHLQESDAF